MYGYFSYVTFMEREKGKKQGRDRRRDGGIVVHAHTHTYTHSHRDRVADRKVGNVLFIDALNTFYLWSYGTEHMVKDQTNNEREKGGITTSWATLFN